MTAKEIATKIRWDLFTDTECFVQIAYDQTSLPGATNSMGVDGFHGLDSNLTNTFQILNHAFKFTEFYIIAVDPNKYRVDIENVSEAVKEKILKQPRAYDAFLADIIAKNG